MRTPLDGFHVDWDKETDQTFDVEKFRYTPLERPAPYNVSFLFDWMDWDKGKYYGIAFEDLWYCKVDLSEDTSWYFDRPLGKGGFGAAALFKKYDDQGEVVDDIVIKSADRDWKNIVNEKRPDLAKEAAIMAQTNDLNSESLLYLRQYKSYAKAAQFRFFLENCEYGDLERLRLRYKAWQRHLPDYFLWHLFYWLIEAAANLESGPFRYISSRKFGNIIDQGYMLHSDIKTENVFLGPHTEIDKNANDYPAPRLADFGLATLTSFPDTSKNTAKRQQRGTSVWYPPEVRYRDLRPGSAWYPFERWGQKNPHDKGSHAITTAANVWAIGAIMWSFVSGHEIEVLSNQIDDILGERQRLHTRGYTIPQIKTSKTPEYDRSLLDLIRDCLKLVPDARPNMNELRNRIMEGLKRQQSIESLNMQNNPEDVAARLKVFYKDNEINDQPLGNAGFTLSPQFWNYFVRHTLWLPEEWGPLLPPGAPTDLRTPTSWPRELRERFKRNLEVARKHLLQRTMPTEASGPIRGRKRMSDEDHSARPPPGLRPPRVPTGHGLFTHTPTIGGVRGQNPEFMPYVSGPGVQGTAYPWGPDDVGLPRPGRPPTPIFGVGRRKPTRVSHDIPPSLRPGFVLPPQPAEHITPTTAHRDVPPSLLPGRRPGLVPWETTTTPYGTTGIAGYVPSFARPAAFRFDPPVFLTRPNAGELARRRLAEDFVPIDLGQFARAHPTHDPGDEHMSDVDMGSAEQ